MKIVLASQSPRRRELLGKMGLEFTTKAPEIDETALSGLPARQLVEALSREKALWAARQEDPEAIVIGSDTVVVRDGEILGKPASPAQAEEMLASLSGRSHEVCTGITVCQGDRVVSQVEVTQVTFRTLTPQEIARYVRTGEPMDKAGAYGIQGLGALLVEGIQGDYSAVVGLPVCRLGRILLDFGVDCLALSAGREEDAL
ncbi:MAG: Maf family protein [Evtepia sp.]|nr:Maf family protein [Evtepia sp.]